MGRPEQRPVDRRPRQQRPQHHGLLRLRSRDRKSTCPRCAPYTSTCQAARSHRDGPSGWMSTTKPTASGWRPPTVRSRPPGVVRYTFGGGIGCLIAETARLRQPPRRQTDHRPWPPGRATENDRSELRGRCARAAATSAWSIWPQAFPCALPTGSPAHRYRSGRTAAAPRHEPDSCTGRALHKSMQLPARAAHPHSCSARRSNSGL
jgi:hypothetical protein